MAKQIRQNDKYQK